MDNRKDQIIEAAVKRFSHFGFHKTTMNEIADDLRITKANLYYYYTDKSALIIDVITKIAKDVYDLEDDIIMKYSGNLLETMAELLEMRATSMKKYYMLHINENLDWIKGIDIHGVMDSFYQRDIQRLCLLFQKAKESNELKLENIPESAQSYAEIIKGLSIFHAVTDMITGIPDEDNVNKILLSQKRATKFIFDSKIISNK